MASYIALLRKDHDSDYGVDFPGCITAGRTLEEARRAAACALGFHIAGMLGDGEAIPDGSSTLDTVMSDPDNRAATAFLVDVATVPDKSLRVNVMLPQSVLAEIDRTTDNRSRWLADAAREKLRRM